MKGESTSDRPHVLFAILDWGMGHATRTWPLIAAARRMGARVTVASRGTAGAWLDARMAEWDALHATPDLVAWRRVEKPGVTIRYARGIGTLPKIALQMPGFVRSIGTERAWTRAFALREGVTHVFSDNCYGALADLSGVSNVFMTHQLHPPVPRLVAGWAKAVVRRLVSRFDAVWVPDTEDRTLAGDLSRPVTPNTRYIGPLSRFQDMEEGPSDLEGEAVLLGLVSGPEPQRSAMEAALRTCFLRDGRPALLLSGQPQSGERREANVLTVHDADDRRFRDAILSAECIVCRSGYSTLMDLAVLGRQAVLIPTIGQPEQETLAREWAWKHGWTTLKASELTTFRPGHMAGDPVFAHSAGATPLLQEWFQWQGVPHHTPTLTPCP